MTIKLKKINIWKILFLYLIFQPSLAASMTQNKSPIATAVTYSDEAIAVAIVVAVMFRLTRSAKLLRFEQIMLIGLFVFEILGIISGFHFKYQQTSYMLVDAFTCVKFFIYYLGARVLTQNKLTEKYFFSLNNICKILAVVLFLLATHDAFFTPWFPVFDFRYFTESVQLWFGHPESLSKACITIIFVLAYNYKYYKRNIYYIFMLTVVMVFTFRTKAIVAVLLLYIIYLYFIKFKFKGIVLPGIVGVVGGSYLAVNSFNDYYISTDESPRAILTADSVNIANSTFPYGSGFGSYASSMAAQHYSRLYYILGYNRLWKMNEYDYSYLNDTFWPVIIAQTGWIGLSSFLVALLSMIVYIIKSRKTDVYYFWVASSIIIYDLISSFAYTAFFHPSSMAPYLLLGLITSIHEFPKQETNTSPLK